MNELKRTPSQSRGLKILKKLYSKNPYDKDVKYHLIRTYIKLGYHNIALTMINDISSERVDIQTLKLKAWRYHKLSDIVSEKKLWNEIIKKQTCIQLDGKLKTLILRSEKQINIQSKDIPLFCTQHNEMLRLSSFLKHYRSLGVTQFFFVDNNSDDGSFEFLLEQPDCHVFWTNDSYHESGYGMVWLHYLIDKYTYLGQWSLVVDADELFVYPYYEEVKLASLITYLNKNNYESVASFMLDMFPKNVAEQLNISSKNSLIEQCPFFLNQYTFDYQLHSPYYCVHGGIFDAMGQLLTLIKTPMIKKLENSTKLVSSTHQTTPTKIADITSCVLHFKFAGDFYQKSISEIKRKQHFSGGIFYKRYANLFKNKIGNNFEFTSLPNVIKYQNSQQLVDLGLIKTTDDWENFVKNYTRMHNYR